MWWVCKTLRHRHTRQSSKREVKGLSNTCASSPPSVFTIDIISNRWLCAA
jgi:hypothetical protein